MITLQDIEKIQNNLPGKTIGIVGDFCIDVYWDVDMTKSELSRETPEFPYPVVGERISLGAGGNVAANLAALKPGKIYALCLTGNDWRGETLRGLIRDTGVSDEYVVSVPGIMTNAYCKPMKHGISATVFEAPRLDFENRSPISDEVQQQVISNLSEMLGKCDIIVVADQFANGIVTQKVREKLSEAGKNGKTVVADSRYNIGLYKNCTLKPNEVECYRSVNGDNGYLTADIDTFTDCAKLLATKTESKVFCTLGANGSVITDGKETEFIRAFHAEGPLDICGAGDTSLSAFCSALVSGCDVCVAAEFAGAASNVTIRKVGITGTASFDEIKEVVCHNR